MAKDPWLLERFEYIDTARAKCRACGQEMDVRAGRARRHYEKAHGEKAPLPDFGPVPTTTGTPAPVFARGSRAWAVGKVLEVADDRAATPEQKLKALDLLKEYEDFGTKRLDDEKEAEQSRLQWDRILSTTASLREEERSLLRDASVRRRLMEVCGELNGPVV